MPNPMTGAGYGKNKEDVKNYTKQTPSKKDDGLAGFSRAQKDRAATRKAARGKDDSVIFNEQKADRAYQNSYIAKGEKASKDAASVSRAGTKGRKKVKLGNVETFKGSLYEKRQQAFLKKMKEMNEKSMKPKYKESQLPPRKN